MITGRNNPTTVDDVGQLSVESHLSTSDLSDAFSVLYQANSAVLLPRAEGDFTTPPGSRQIDNHSRQTLKDRASQIRVRLDRVQLVSWARQGRKPPRLEGYKIVRDCYVRRQTTTATYARSRYYQSITNNAKIFWQYNRLKGWLRPWKITIVADDQSGLSYEEVARVLKYCRHYRFLIVEIAVDFSPSSGVNERFIRQHAVFGKSRRRA